MTQPRKRQSEEKPRTTKSNTVPCLPHEPGVSQGAVDVVGIVPEDVHVDPEITEGHAGYEESGASGIKPSKLDDGS
jgi:hypothetical protein